MKKYFHSMACHNPKKPKSDCFAVLRMTIVAKHLLQTNSHLLPHSQYAAMRANHVTGVDSVRVGDKKRGRESGPKGVKLYADPGASRMQACIRRLEDEVCTPCS